MARSEIITGIAAGVGLGALFVVLWLGFKLLLLPLRLLWRFGRTLADQIGPISLLLLLIWTIALEPEPFVYLWDWFLRLGRALLVDAPRQLSVAIPRLMSVCSSVDVCLVNLGIAVQQLWSTTMAQPIRDFAVPPRLDNALLVFAVGTTIAFAAARFPAASWGRGSPTEIPKIAALTASFVVALYLGVLAIMAVPVFGQKVPDLAPYRTSLAEQLTKATPPKELTYPFLSELAEERDNLPNFAELRVSLSSKESSRVGLSILETTEITWASQLELWNQSLSRLREATEALPLEARKFTQTAQSFFQVSNEGHIGETATQRHVTVLANQFNLWLSDYESALDGCVARLREGLGRFRSFYTGIVPIIRTVSSDALPPVESINQAFSGLAIQRCDNIKPVVRDYLPERSGPEETLGGPFGPAAAWLLRTENPEMALIIGLLGFGFLGALAASFVREFAGTPGNELPPASFIIPALIRGVGAAILIFLLAKGGTAIFTRGEATPNAYAIFFACFVAAVFSEDVWSWARTRQRDQLPAREGQKPSGASAPRRDQLPAGADQEPAASG